MATHTVTAQQVDSIMQDYRIYLTGAGYPTRGNEREQRESSNPPSWPSDRNRIPPYRPINRHLNLEERPLGSSALERAFLVAMFSGVTMNASMAKLWGATGGPLFPRLFRYAIGGEW
ncbi:hypothetical protein OIDMADRAFT_150265 [Oidiodendron maius Zn]|uniref:Uncharacterized protein n=1 Tax=Oidiodendron maius (strain Zn) TaxID=913774 RepID=A0A0C3E468_OIDMZ|nr:hypothetical protein OIDMADRAFT_150265 [Oidiodendron maius Zn]